MSPRKMRWPVIVASIMVAAILAGLGTVQVRQAREKGEIAEELRRAQQALSEFEVEQSSSDESDMQERLSEALAHFDSTRIDLSQPTDSIVANKAFFDIATANDVSLTEIAASAQSTAILADVSFSVLPFTVGAEGEVPRLLDFIDALNTSLDNGVVRSATLVVPDAADGRLPSASIEMVIYVYQGG